MSISAAVALALAPAGPATLELKPPVQARSTGRRSVLVEAEQLFAVADRARVQGDAGAAEAAYAALAQDPDGDIRAEALFRLGKMLSDQGRLTEAAQRLRQLVDSRPNAAAPRLALAQVFDRMGDADAAFRQVRAVRSAGLPREVARLVDRYSAALQGARRSGASLEIAFAPDSNINRATRSDTLGTIFGNFDIDDSGKAKSGIGLAVKGDGYRRIPLGDGDANLVLRVNGFSDLYAKPQYNDIGLEFAGGPELHLGRSRVTVEAAVASRWFGQRAVLRSGRLSANLTRPLTATTQLRVGGSLGISDNLLNDLQDGKSVSARLVVDQALSPAFGIAISLSADRFSARDPGYSQTAWRTGLSAWRDLGRATIVAGVEIGRLRADERLLLFPQERSDTYSKLSMGAVFRNVTIGGFSPSFRFSVERNKSSIEFYDYSRKRTEFAFVRPF